MNSRKSTKRKLNPPRKEKMRIVKEGILKEQPLSAICYREGITVNVYYQWMKELIEANVSLLNFEGNI